MNGDLNDIINRQGEPAYYTPPTVYGNLIENHDGGQVTIINPPFGECREPQHRVHRKNWKKMWRLWPGLYPFSNNTTSPSFIISLRTSLPRLSDFANLIFSLSIPFSSSPFIII